ncbi:zinc finger, CCHC-type containing protein [Tanacetum coccineum]
MGDENPIRTLGDYSKRCNEGYRNTIKLPIGNNVVPLRPDTLWEITRLCLFQFSLRDQASNWLERLPAGSITTWKDLTTRFLAHGESLSEAWTRFKDLLQKVPHHGIDLWLQIQILYDRIDDSLKRRMSAERAWVAIEELV